MKFAKEGYVPAAIPAGIGIAVWALFSPLLGAALLVFAAAVLAFFRDPERTPEGGEGAIIAPADGKVVFAGPVEKRDPLAPDSGMRVSIFMSPLNVHVNRIPTSGTVEDIRYNKGKFEAVFREKAAEVNESSAMLFKTDSGLDMVVIQIAGWLARRIVCKVAPGTALQRGERFGLIMFGSRVDVYLPNTVSLSTKVGDRVAAGRTVIAQESAPS
jgi:phosphatidylserine decarboxylase